MLNVQFSDEKEAAVITYFGGINDPDVWSNLGQISESDPRWLAYYDAQPLILQQFLPAPIQ